MNKDICSCCERTMYGLNFEGLNDDEVCVFCRSYIAFGHSLFMLEDTPKLIDIIKDYIKKYKIKSVNPLNRTLYIPPNGIFLDTSMMSGNMGEVE